MNILELIYPTVCGVCDKICKNNICEICEENLQNEINCIRIRYNNKEFNEHVFFCKYDGILRERILDYKFNQKAYLYKFFSEIIIKNEKQYGIFEKYDIITSVPIHKKRKLVRGYNQSELIAKEIAKNYENLKYKNLLNKIKNTEPQSTLNKEQRKNNVNNAFKIKDILLENKKIILFDDIYTTGSTVNECSKLLIEKGAENILVVTIAKDYID